MGDKKANLVLIGVSGCGKGTQARLIAKEYGFYHISSGEVLRREVAKKTPIGKKILRYQKNGQWVPDKIIAELITPRLEEHFEEGFILDGSPRTVVQARLIDDFLKTKNEKIDLVFLIEVRPEIVLARRKRVISRGGKFQPGRKDDDTKTFQKRFDSYTKTIKPILDYYQKNKVLVKINGERSVDEIYKDIKREIEKI